MAFEYFKFGNLQIPILGTIEKTGDPPRTNFFLINPANILPNNFDWYGELGAGVVFSETAAGNTDCYLSNTPPDNNVDIHNNYTFKVDSPYAGTSNPGYSIPYTGKMIYALNGNDILAFNITVAPSYSVSWNGYTKRYAVMYRVKYENYDHPSYLLVCANFDFTSSGVSITNKLWYLINPYYTYYDQSTETWFEEYTPGPTPGDDPFDPSDPEPYDPDGDDSSDLIPIPPNPPIGVTNAGFIHVYKPSAGDLTGLGEIIFPDPLAGLSQDVLTALIKLCECFANQNLINYVIDCHVIPVSPQVGANANIKVGFRDTGISVPVVTSDYIDATCGSISLAEFFGGALDYTQTRSKLFLPFVGFVDMRPEFWQAGTLSVDYKFNVIDGSFMCYVRSVSSKSKLNGSIIAQYSGNACMHFPLTGVNYSSMVSGIIGAVTNPTVGGSASPVLGAAFSAMNTIAQGGDVQQSNGYNSTAGLLGVRKPYLMIERPVPSWSAKYRHDKGLPANIATLLSNVTGFTVIDDIDLSGLPFTEGEITELRGLLKEGVYF